MELVYFYMISEIENCTSLKLMIKIAGINLMKDKSNLAREQGERKSFSC